MPFFSVIIPLYNKEDLVEQTITSLLNQLFTDFEVIIVNDGSTDNSLSKITPLIDSRFTIINQNNKGAASSRNTGVTLSKGSYIALLDADDLWKPNHLFELKKLIETFPSAGLYCNNYEIFYTNDLSNPAQFNFEFNDDCLIVPDFFKASITNCVAWTSAVGFSKRKFEAVGGFNPELKTAQDLDLWIKMALKYDVAFNPKITMSYLFHIEDSLSKSDYNNIRYDFINNFSAQEINNPSLKLYLDINRYAVALRCKMNSELDLYKKLKTEIDYQNLNFKQKTLLNCPTILIKQFIRLHRFFKKNNIYISTYS